MYLCRTHAPSLTSSLNSHIYIWAHQSKVRRVLQRYTVCYGMCGMHTTTYATCSYHMVSKGSDAAPQWWRRSVSTKLFCPTPAAASCQSLQTVCHPSPSAVTNLAWVPKSRAAHRVCVRDPLAASWASGCLRCQRRLQISRATAAISRGQTDCQASQHPPVTGCVIRIWVGDLERAKRQQIYTIQYCVFFFFWKRERLVKMDHVSSWQ